MLEHEKAEMKRIDNKIHELCDKKEKLEEEIEQLWKERSSLQDKMLELIQKK